MQYHLIDSIEPKRLAGRESALVDDHLAALARHGVVLDRDRAATPARGLRAAPIPMAGVVANG